MDVRIPSKKIQEGIEYSLEKSAQHLTGAEACLSKGILDGAVALIEYAVEEFGRAVALREKLETGSEEVERELFSSHEYKYEKAWTVLPQELKTIYEGTFDVAVFDEAVFDVGKESISPRVRLDAIFVNYDETNDKWKIGIRADKHKLKRLIEGIKQCINDFEFLNKVT